ncbi:MAG TPA: hypothetical protein VEO19_11430 [Terriglobia bacterium]|nr:hypothetical protein [Terriglobia bacterium]
MSTAEIPAPDSIPISEYIQGQFVPISHLAHGWEIHSMIALTPAEERTMVREPAQAVPAGIAERLGPLRVLIVPYIACEESGDVVCPAKPKGETHTAAWVETSERTNLLLASREVDAHDTGFEFLASVAELLRPRLSTSELAAYDGLLDEELRHGVRGEIDEESLTAKQALLAIRPWRRSRLQYEPYRDVSLVSTIAEYMHGLWHDVQIRIGPQHLPLQQLRRRMTLMSNLFPPNPGYAVFAKELEGEQKEDE